MVNHLKLKHNVTGEARLKTLVDQLKFKSLKQAWSCGFCVKCFLTFEERLEHISAQHFERCWKHDEWNATNVIAGLLLQPGVAAAWEHLMISKHGWNRPSIVWTKKSVKGLRIMLEEGPSAEQSAERLAEVAYNKSDNMEGFGLSRFALPVPNIPVQPRSSALEGSLCLPMSILPTPVAEDGTSDSFMTYNHSSLWLTGDAAEGAVQNGVELREPGVESSTDGINTYTVSTTAVFQT